MNRLIAVLVLALGFAAALFTGPGAAIAHPGHGTLPPDSMLHEIAEHGLWIMLAAPVAAWLLWRRASRRNSP